MEEGRILDPLLRCACNRGAYTDVPCHLRCIRREHCRDISVTPIGGIPSYQPFLAGFHARVIEGYSAHRLDEHRALSPASSTFPAYWSIVANVLSDGDVV